MAANRGVIPPIPQLREAGCPIALGTDNNTNDLFEVMRIALLTERVRRTDAFPGVRPQPEDILADATESGSRAVNQQKTIGSLEVGKKADLFVLNTLKPYLVPAGRLVSAVIHGGHPSDIESVMVDGEFIMRDNKVLTLDEPALLREADAVGKRIWSAVGPVNVPRLPRPK
jgi:5-methylthioadenosine/S-adenosylhomocysteine deaminase